MAERKALLPFAALSATYFAHIGLFNSYLPLWLKDLGLGLLTISVLSSMQAVTRLFAPYVWGWLSDHTGERVRFLRWGAAVALLCASALWWSLSPVMLGVVLLVMFTHTSAMMPMSEAAMAHLVSLGGGFDARRYGRVRLWGSLGFMATVFVAGAWFEAQGMQSFATWTVLSLLAVWVSTLLMPNLKEAQPVHAQSVRVWAVVQRPEVRWFFIAAFFHVLSHMGLYVFFSLYLDALGYSKTMIGALWAVSVLVEIAWFFTQSRWLPRLPLTAWIVLCSAAMALRMGVTTVWADVLWVLLLAQALHALTFAAHHTACVALLSHHFPGRMRGRGQALYTVIAYGVPGVLGGFAGGVISEYWGLRTVFAVMTLCALLAMAAGWRMWRLTHPAAMQ
ncbi:MFS transporter [Limnohabitans sp.]|uniref:MFS transporter n=1 Tax=Limnohabitans sp. TaxID=1907725 RepID=UPI00311FE525